MRRRLEVLLQLGIGQKTLLAILEWTGVLLLNFVGFESVITKSRLLFESLVATLKIALNWAVVCVGTEVHC